MREIGNSYRESGRCPIDLGSLLVRKLQQIIEQPEFMHHLECRGMDGVPAEIAETIGMLLEHDDRHSGAGQHQAEHHPGRPTADDAALSCELLYHHVHKSRLKIISTGSDYQIIVVYHWNLAAFLHFGSLVLEEADGVQQLREIVNDIVGIDAFFFLRPLVGFEKDRFYADSLSSIHIAVHIVAHIQHL